VTFDDDRAVAGAGLALVATLSKQLGTYALANQVIDLGGRPGHALPGRKVLTLVHAMVAGADCIDDCDVLRSGATGKVLGHGVMAPSTLGTFLRSFTFGHVRQLDRLSEALLTRAWAFGAGPGDDPMTIDIDSTIQQVYGKQKEGAAYGYTKVLGEHPLVATRSDTGEVLHIRHRKGSANAGRGGPRFVRELIGRARRAGATGPLTLRADSGFHSKHVVAACRDHDVRYHAFITDREGTAVFLDADHRHHAVVELAIRDLKEGAGMAHCPSGDFNANAAWAVLATIAHNMMRWLASLGLGHGGPVVAKTIRRRFITVPGRLTRRSRRTRLHMPTAWPWATEWSACFDRLRALSLRT